ncbi:hypothetical protein ACFE04_000953 [Oxalis oulophora]
MIPKRIVNNHEDDWQTTNTVFLERPSGKKWEVGLEKDDGNIWLKHDFDQFVKRYSIVCGNLIALKYNGSSTFIVKIYSESIESEGDDHDELDKEILTSLKTENIDSPNQNTRQTLRAPDTFYA